MSSIFRSKAQVLKIIKKSPVSKQAVAHFPSRGQTTTQQIYHTKHGKLFLKRTSDRNHRDCQIDPQAASLAEREFWCYRFAHKIGLACPELILLDEHTTVQRWWPYPDAHIYTTRFGPLVLWFMVVTMCLIVLFLIG